MPKPDAALKEFLKDNDVYAAVFNGYFFDGRTVFDPKDLEPENVAYAESVNTKQRVEKINKYRDNVRRTSKGFLIILGIDDQNKIHYSMPVRKMLYDVLGYSSEIKMLGKIQDQSSWTVDERLSGVAKGTKVTPIVTVVLYTGEDEWDGPRSLHDMMDIDEEVKPFVPDYTLYVIDIGHDEKISFPNKSLEELRIVLSAIYSDTADKNDTEIDTAILALAAILSGDGNLYKAAQSEAGRRQKMCKVLERRDERIFLQFKSQLEEKDAALEENRVALEEKDAEIAKLRAQIAELSGKQ